MNAHDVLVALWRTSQHPPRIPYADFAFLNRTGRHPTHEFQFFLSFRRRYQPYSDECQYLLWRAASTSFDGRSDYREAHLPPTPDSVEVTFPKTGNSADALTVNLLSMEQTHVYTGFKRKVIWQQQKEKKTWWIKDPHGDHDDRKRQKTEASACDPLSANSGIWREDDEDGHVEVECNEEDDHVEVLISPPPPPPPPPNVPVKGMNKGCFFTRRRNSDEPPKPQPPDPLAQFEGKGKGPQLLIPKAKANSYAMHILQGRSTVSDPTEILPLKNSPEPHTHPSEEYQEFTQSQAPVTPSWVNSDGEEDFESPERTP